MTEDEARAWVAARVSRETLQRLDQYDSLLRKWQASINLVSPATLPRLWARHVADSLQLLLLANDDAGTWLDLGSGGGFPGLACAVAARDTSPNLAFALVESDQRKAAFLREAARITDTPTRVETVRIEDLPPQSADVISARALAPLHRLAELAAPHLGPGAVALFPKGRTHQSEAAEADRIWRMQRTAIPSITDPEAVIFRVKGLSRV